MQLLLHGRLAGSHGVHACHQLTIQPLQLTILVRVSTMAAALRAGQSIR